MTLNLPHSFTLSRIFCLVSIALAACIRLDAQSHIADFHAPTSIRGGYINALVEQPDGKILVGGDIRSYGDTPVSSLIRLNPDGTLDNSFSFPSPPDYFVYDLDLAASGEILVVLRKYAFLIEFPASESKIMKLHADGSVAGEITTPPPRPGRTAGIKDLHPR